VKSGIAEKKDERERGEIVFFIFLLTVSIAGIPVTAGDWAGNAFLSSFRRVEVRVNFGPAGKPAVEKKIDIRGYSTPKEALKEILPVEEGQVCSSPREVKGIDGVMSDPARSLWWHVEVNGSQNVSSYKTRLRAGDLVEWVYEEEKT